MSVLKPLPNSTQTQQPRARAATKPCSNSVILQSWDSNPSPHAASLALIVPAYRIDELIGLPLAANLFTSAQTSDSDPFGFRRSMNQPQMLLDLITTDGIGGPY